MRSLSKFLSLILRHKPETIGIKLESTGWVEVTTLLEALKRHSKEYENITLNTIKKIVRDDNKNRYSLEDGMIRANQGHSIDVDLGLDEKTPPDILYHGTPQKFRAIIQKEGLKKMSRHHVHLSHKVHVAAEVGSRRGVPHIFAINASKMVKDGYKFYCSENGVWLTDKVPSEYLMPVIGERNV